MALFGGPSYSIAEALTSEAPSPENDTMATFFVRALYDYQSTDASSLSFRSGDLIEVLSQLESGWWDGLLDNERGWFPSNYVAPVSEQEVEEEFVQATSAAVAAANPGDGMAPPNGHPSQNEDDSEWSEEDLLGGGGGITRLAETVMNSSSSAAATASDFWMPQVTSDGQVYYLNTQTGEQSLDLPAGMDDVPDDGGVYALERSAAATHTRSTTSSSFQPPTSAGFGVPRRTGTPEPWVRRLADDGMSYYYYNPVTGQSQWSPPSPGQSSDARDTSSERESSREDHRPTAISTRSRLRTDSEASHIHRPSSVYSDDSEINPHGNSRPPSQPTDLHSTARSTIVGPSVPLSDIASAETTALELQNALLPPPKETVRDLSNAAREAIAAIVDTILERRPRHETPPPDSTRSETMKQRVAEVVAIVRNLLYVSGTLGAPASSLSLQGAVDETAESARSPLLELKPFQRKVTATLSKLVLSARAANTNPDWPQPDNTSRVDADAAELERAVVAFAVEVQRSPAATRSKRLHGVFVSGEGLAGVGPGLLGAGAAGRWKGLGFVPLENSVAPPQQPLDEFALNELRRYRTEADNTIALIEPVQTVEAMERLIYQHGRLAVAYISSFTALVDDIDFAYYLDVEGVRGEQTSEQTSSMKEYMDSVHRARTLIRALETAKQALYDDGIVSFLALQTLSEASSISQVAPPGSWETLEAALSSAKSNLAETFDIFEALMNLSKRQVHANQNGINGRVGSRAIYQRSDAPGRDRADSTVASLDDWYQRSRSNTNLSGYGASTADESTGPSSRNVADMERELRLAAGPDRFDPKNLFYTSDGILGGEPHMTHTPRSMSIDRATDYSESAPSLATTAISTDALIPSSSQTSPAMTATDPKTLARFRQKVDLDGDDSEDDGLGSASKSPKRGMKIKKILGGEAPDEYIARQNADLTPWYLRAIHGPNEILINPDGGVRGGTLPALIERLTMHDMRGDPIFIETFLMTFRSFATGHEVVELLKQRFHIKAPEGLTAEEHKIWVDKKQKPIMVRVINVLKSLVQDGDLADQPEVLDEISEFATSVVSIVPVSRTLLVLVDRAKQGNPTVHMTPTSRELPPASYIPRRGRLKLLDIEPLELARQLTLVESQLYLKITPTECLARGKDSADAGRVDNIKSIISTANKIAEWVAESILSKEDPRKRAMIIKQFILVAERCRHLNNFSSMAALIAGLNTPPIRRLKRSWEQVTAKTVAMLDDVERTLDSGKNFAGYRQLLAKVHPPCVPFLGVYLTILIYINDGNKDILVKEGNLINFNKRQKAAEVIREIKKFQSAPYNFTTVDSIQAFIKESLTIDKPSDFFWQLSLEREPREREDEKMARLLQESGFL